MSLMSRLMAERLKKKAANTNTHELELVPGLRMPEFIGRPSVPPSASGLRGPCKAINATTGRQCCLLIGHVAPHRHGSTSFERVAAPEQTHFARRDALDALASSRSRSSTDTEE